MVTEMKPTITVPLLSIPLLLLATGSSWAQQSPAPVPVTEPVTTTAPAPAAAETTAAAELPADATPVAAAEPAATPPEASDKATATATATVAATPAAATTAPTSLSADEIARRHPSEWNALIDQREREMERMRQSSYPTWPSPYDRGIDHRSQQMQNQIQGRVEQLQRRIDSERYRYQSPWDRASSDWWDHQRSQSRLQSLRTQEYLDQMMQRGMGPNQGGPNPGYRGYRGPRGW